MRKHAKTKVKISEEMTRVAKWPFNLKWYPNRVYPLPKLCNILFLLTSLGC